MSARTKLLSRAGDHRLEKQATGAGADGRGAGEAACVNIVSGGIMFMQPNLISAPRRTVITFVFTSEPR